MTPEETEIRRKLRDNFPHYASRCLNIRTKAGKVERLELNAAQLLIHERIEAQRAETGKVRAIILKGRQQGCSTYVEARYYWRVTHRSGVRAFILTHEAEATNNLFDMAVRYHENCPDPVRPSTGAANAKELIFDKLDSGYKVGTAGTKGVGRSSTIQYFHGCLSPGTFIVTETGDLRPMGDYQVGDLVRTHTGAIAPVSFISLQQKPAFRVTLKGLSQMPLVATAEHRFLTPGGWRELGEMSPGDHLLFPVPGIVTDDVVWPFRLTDKVRPQGGGTRETGPDEVAPSYELGRVLGLYLAEGCIAKQSKTGEPSAVTFAVHEREVARTEAWLQSIAHLFRSSRTSPRATSKTVTVTVYGRSFATFVRSLCGELDGKRMPANWHRCGPDFARGMVHGYLSGDGCSSKREYDRRISAPSIRPAITVGMRDALAALGYGWACIAYHPGRLRYGKAARPAWTLRLSGAGVDRLCDELGWSMPPRRRHGAYGEVRVEGGYARVPVVAIDDVGVVDVMDFEVGHDDHSYCTVHAATHNSEVGFWPFAHEHAAGVMQAIPDAPDTEVILESTANGVGNFYHEQWTKAVAGESEFIAIFVPWFLQPEYRSPAPKDIVLDEGEAELVGAYGLDLDQIAWRRKKVAELGSVELFRQEYPCSPDEAFQTSIEHAVVPIELVRSAINRNVGQAGYRRVWGLDVARSLTGDRTALAKRWGNTLLEPVKWWRLPDLMQIAGTVYQEYLAAEEKPDEICVDVIGFGAGVVDRLNEMGLPVTGINVAESPSVDGAKYMRLRDELWFKAREWFEGRDVRMPPDEALIGELTGVKYKITSSGKLQVEGKDEMKARGLRSPDLADAFCLALSASDMPPQTTSYQPPSYWDS